MTGFAVVQTQRNTEICTVYGLVAEFCLESAIWRFSKVLFEKLVRSKFLINQHFRIKLSLHWWSQCC